MVVGKVLSYAAATETVTEVCRKYFRFCLQADYMCILESRCLVRVVRCPVTKWWKLPSSRLQRLSVVTACQGQRRLSRN